MKIRYINKKEGTIIEMVVIRELKHCYDCRITNAKYYKGNFRIYKNWIGMDNDSYKVETF